MAGVALENAVAAEHPLVPPADILAALRAENQMLVGQVSEASARVTQFAAELDHAKAEQAQTKETAFKAVAEAKREASSAIAMTQKQAQVAERAAAAARMTQHAVGAIGGLVSFLVDRAPVLGTLTGAYLLARSVLDAPTIQQLVALGIYGAVAVLPAVYLSVRRS